MIAVDEVGRKKILPDGRPLITPEVKWVSAALGCFPTHRATTSLDAFLLLTRAWESSFYVLILTH